MEKNNLIVGIVLALVLGTIAYASNNDIQTKEKIVTKIIDGDTIIVEGGETIRLLGIDTDEKSHKCYNEAKNRLEEILLNKKINLEITGKDPYGRYLAYVKLNEENINLKIIKEGLAVARLNEESLYKNAFIDAEKNAKENKIGCKWGDNSIPNVCEAMNYLNKDKTLQGTIKDVYVSKTGTVFLNFEEKFPNSCFTAVIFKKTAEKLKLNYQNYINKKIFITGKIKEYNGKPEIIINDKNQIIILQRLP